MPLQKQDIDLPFAAGLEQATRDEVRDPALGFSELSNVVQRKRGAYSKRTGRAALTSQPGTALVALASHRDDVLVTMDGQRVHVHGSSDDVWSTRGLMPGLTTQRYPLASAGIFRGTVVYDVVQAGGYLVMVYETARALYATVFDATTRATVLGPTKLADGLSGADALQEFRATVVACGAFAVVLYNRENVVGLTREDALKWATLDTTSLTWSASANLLGAGIIDLTVGTFLFDACSISASYFALAYRALAGDITVVTYDLAGTQVATVIAFAGAPGTSYAWSVDGVLTDTLWLARIRANSTVVDVEARNPGTLAVTGTTLLAGFPSQLSGSESSHAAGSCSMVRTAAGEACLVVSGSCTSFGDYERYFLGWRRFSVSGGAVVTSGAASAAANLEHVSKPWLSGGRVYVTATPWDNLDTLPASMPIELASATNRQRCMYVVDITEARSGDVPPAATLAPRVNGERGMLYFPRYTRQVADLGGGAVGVVYPSLRSASAETFELAVLSPVGAVATAELGGLLHASGGCAWAYDGSKTLETAFLQAPRAKAFEPHNAGTLSGTFLYVAVWEHVDAAGNVHYSEPSLPITVTVATKEVRIRVTTPTVTLRDDRTGGADRVRCVLYRTVTTGGTYYRCAETPAYDPATTCGGSFVLLLDSMSDAVLSQRQRLYTQPGTLGTSLPRRAPPGLRGLVQHGDTLAGIADDGRTIWFSAPVVGGEGQWFQDLFVGEVNDTTPLVALASFDGRLWAFTRSGVWVIDGQGFVENGSGGYSLPARVPCDVGCVEPRSLIVTPMGAMFQSEQGIALLSRGGQVSFFGEGVADVLAAYPTCTGVALDPSETQVTWNLRNGSAGVALVHDYNTGAWTTETGVYDAAAMVGGVLHRGLADVVYRRSPGTYLDPGPTWVGQTIETGWFKVAGLQGFQRIKRLLLLFTRRTVSGLRVSIGYDYDTAYTDVREWTTTTLPAGRLEISPVRQRCTAIRVRVQELEPDPSERGTGQGLEFVGLRLVAAVKSRTPFARTQKV